VRGREVLRQTKYKTKYFTSKGVTRIFHWGTKTEGPKIEAEAEADGTASPSPPAKGPEERCGLPSGVRGGSPTTQSFPLFSALMTASPDTIIVDYDAAIGRPRSPWPPCVRPWSRLAKLTPAQNSRLSKYLHLDRRQHTGISGSSVRCPCHYNFFTVS